VRLAPSASALLERARRRPPCNRERAPKLRRARHQRSDRRIQSGGIENTQELSKPWPSVTAKVVSFGVVAAPVRPPLLPPRQLPGVAGVATTTDARAPRTRPLLERPRRADVVVTRADAAMQRCRGRWRP
jgi:hypothetical protein